MKTNSNESANGSRHPSVFGPPSSVVHYFSSVLFRPSSVIFLLPLLYLAWSLFVSHLAGPFYLSRCDPEYPYLLNGLNSALLNFQNIGHTDHPGTPFQLLSGLFIRITHVFAGQGTVIDDVITRPEMYLAFSSFYLAILTFFLLTWLGRMVFRHSQNLMGVVIIQSSVLLSSVLIDFPMRYNPDRLLVLYGLVFAGICYEYIFIKSLSDKTFALLSGILMGIGFTTKFNFLPLLVMPVILVPKWRSWLIYAGSFIASGFLCILPIIGKFSEFRKFISGVATHDGLYGQGTEQMINWQEFTKNIYLIFKYNPAYALLFAAVIAVVVFLIFNSRIRKARHREFLFLAAFLLASFLGFIMVAKHFKNYYFAPVLSLAGFAALILLKPDFIITRHRIRSNIIPPLVLIVLILIALIPGIPDYGLRAERQRQNRLTAEFYHQHTGPNDILFIEPTWLAGPMVENALVYGISYVAHRHLYFPEYLRNYPQVVTWEGNNQPLKHFRTINADHEALLKSGKDFYILSSPGRDAGKLVSMIDSLGSRHGVTFGKDTVFANRFNQELIIRLKPGGTWRTLLESNLTGPDVIKLDQGNPNSPLFPIQNVKTGDYLEATVLLETKDPQSGTIILRSPQSDIDNVYFSDSQSLYESGKHWRLLRLRAHILQPPAGGKLTCQFYFPGNSSVRIKDFRISHFGQR